MSGGRQQRTTPPHQVVRLVAARVAGGRQLVPAGVAALQLGDLRGQRRGVSRAQRAGAAERAASCSCAQASARK